MKENIDQTYIHSFDRFIDVNDAQVDRLEQILKHGVLSPKKARELNVPYQRWEAIHVPIEGYDDIIFLHSINERKGIGVPGDVTLFFDESVEPMDLKKIREDISPYWPLASIGERYIKGIIEPEKIKKIGVRGPIEGVIDLVEKYRNIPYPTVFNI